jgi:hypothetical protein
VEPDFDFDETPFLEPAPDEEAWEAYLTLALDRMGADGANGLSNAQVLAVEAALGATLPFEVGLFLVMGIPDGEGWIDWGDDPAAQIKRWNEWVLEGLRFDVEHNDFWAPRLGRRPAEIADRITAVESTFDELPQLFPLHGRQAMPLTIADNATSNSGNPVLSINGTEISVYGHDLAAFLHRDFDVPLPMWPAEDQRHFGFWSDLADI